MTDPISDQMIPDDVVDAVNAVLPQLFRSGGSRDLARAAITALLAKRPDVARVLCQPDRYAVVPAEATEAMKLAALDGWNNWPAGSAASRQIKPANGYTVEAWGRVWTHMITEARKETTR